jgi:hypothetical protein
MEREFRVRYRVTVEGSTVISAADPTEAERIFEYGDWERDAHEEMIEDPAIFNIVDEDEDEDEDDQDYSEGEEEEE